MCVWSSRFRRPNAFICMEIVMLSELVELIRDGVDPGVFAFRVNARVSLLSGYVDRVKCRYNAVQRNMVLYMVRQRLRQNLHQRVYLQKSPHNSPSQDLGDKWPCYKSTALYGDKQQQGWRIFSPGDVIWRQRYRSTFAQVMVSCLAAPSHYPNQCSLIINVIFGIHMMPISHALLKISIHDMSLKITNLRVQPHLPGANELIAIILCDCIFIVLSPTSVTLCSKEY